MHMSWLVVAVGSCDDITDARRRRCTVRGLCPVHSASQAQPGARRFGASSRLHTCSLTSAAPIGLPYKESFHFSRLCGLLRFSIARVALCQRDMSIVSKKKSNRPPNSARFLTLAGGGLVDFWDP